MSTKNQWLQSSYYDDDDDGDDDDDDYYYYDYDADESLYLSTSQQIASVLKNSGWAMP